MSRHSQGGWRGGGGEKASFQGSVLQDAGTGARRRRMQPVVWVLAGAALIVWSLLAWFAYEVADGVTGWLNTNSAPTLDSAKDLAALSSVGKDAALIFEKLGGPGLVAQGADLLRGIAKPVVVVIWVLGAVSLVLAPFVLSRLGGVLAASRRGGSHH